MGGCLAEQSYAERPRTVLHLGPFSLAASQTPAAVTDRSNQSKNKTALRTVACPHHRLICLPKLASPCGMRLLSRCHVANARIDALWGW